MASQIDITVAGADEAIAKVGILADTPMVEIADALSALGASQTQRRIHSEKTSPAGRAWQPNRRGSSILFLSGALAAEMSHRATDATAMWGSPLVYAAIHNFGGTIRAKKGKALRVPGQGRQDIKLRKSVTMPQRQFLGVSTANADEMEAMVEGLYREKLG